MMAAKFEIKSKFKTELAADYNISLTTLKFWVKKLPGEVQEKLKWPIGKVMLTPNQVKILVDYWGFP